MAIIHKVPPPEVITDAVYRELRGMGIKPFVLQQWKVRLTENPLAGQYELLLSWRNFRIPYYFNHAELERFDRLLFREVARQIADRLRVFNQAEDEEHMHAIVLLTKLDCPNE